ncbi:MAG TPA: efflux transporter outer membrane subunit [Steroidobacteraceae bacterium]|nr:efflux transporter outer membrane subunit [Steroidobacteraceae bacterium]
MTVRRTMRPASRFGRLAACALLTGCSLAPPPDSEELRERVLPTTPLPAQWTAGHPDAGSVENNWLATFGDPQLEELVAEAVFFNSDLRLAAARFEQAAALVRVAGGKLYPAVNFVARGGGKSGGDDSGLEGAVLSASWELDLWGRVRYEKRAAQDQFASTEADFTFARQSLAALVAKSWFLATEASLQRDLLTEMASAGSSLLDLANERMRIGIGNELDVTSARVNLQTVRDNLRQVELSYEQARRALEVLLGRYPAAELGAPTQFVNLSEAVPAGLPSDLLERRPDVIAAQKRVAAAFSRVKEAQMARLPKITLSGSGSDLTSDLFVLQDRDNPVWSAGGSVLAPLFTGGALKGQVEVRTAEQKQAIAQYVQTALKAFADVENALSNEQALQEREAILASAVSDAKRALELAETRYRVGAGDLRSVEQQQLTYRQARMTLLRVQSERRVQRVNLHLALGGDFAPQV